MFACKDDVITCTCSCYIAAAAAAAAASFLLFNEKMEYLQASTGALVFFLFSSLSLQASYQIHMQYETLRSDSVPLLTLNQTLAERKTHGNCEKQGITQEVRKEYQLVHPLWIYHSVDSLSLSPRRAHLLL